MAFVNTPDFRLIQGAEQLTDYQHTKNGKPEPFLHLTFCRTCGIRPFSRGGYLPQFGSDFYAVNLGCLDDASDAELAAAKVSYPDGRADDWARESDATRYL